MSTGRPGGVARLLLGSILFLSAAPALAEVGATLTLASQERFRGYSVSDGYPAATLSLSYDDASGPYVEGSVMVAGNLSEGAERSRVEGNAGYALRLRNGPTLDAGIVHAEYRGYRIYGAQAVFTEVYAGIITDHLSAHAHYSPNYFQRDISTLYTDIEGTTQLGPRLRLTAHYGMLFQMHGKHEQAGTTTEDWRIGVSTDVKKLSFALAFASGSDKRSFYGAVKKGGTALLFSVTTAF